MENMLRDVVMAFWPGGGQGTARRNAWAAMAADAKRARQRAEAASFMNAVVAVHERQAATAIAAHA